MAMSREGANTRLKTISEVSNYLGQAVNTLSSYERDWGPEGFIHCVIELANAAYLSLETSKAILQEYTKDTLYSKKGVPAEPEEHVGNADPIPAVAEVPRAARFRDIMEIAPDFGGNRR